MDLYIYYRNTFFSIFKKIFSSFPDKGYIFSKTFGILIVSYLIFLTSTLHVLSFSRINIFIVLLISSIISIFISFYDDNKFNDNLKGFSKFIKSKFRLLLLEEVIFTVALIFWSTIRSFQPDLRGIEKFMDFSFINSILRTTYFPAKDPWFSPLSINYYYFGHVYSAVLIKLTDIPSFISFNLMIATIFALLFSSTFSISFALIMTYVRDRKIKIVNILWIKVFIFGIFSSFLLTLSGNLQTIYAFFRQGPKDSAIPFWKLSFSLSTFPNSYWYPNATRFIYHSIHEFPAYALTLADLHAHLLDSPFILITIGFFIQLFTKNHKNKYSEFILTRTDGIIISLFFAAMYMTNAWDFGIFFFISLVFISYLIIKKGSSPKKSLTHIIKYILILLSSSVIISLPFSYFFKPFISGIGINCSPNFLVSLGKIGPFLFEKGYCQITPPWQYMILYGFFIFSALVFLIFKKRNKFYPTDIFISLLFLSGFMLTLLPELIYLKDIYPDYFRANTMFKLAYASFIILSITSSYSIFRILTSVRFSLKSYKKNSIILIFFGLSSTLILITGVYPFLAIGSAYNNLVKFQGLDGQKYLQSLYPGDYDAVIWMNKYISGQPGILEATGDSYSDFGRISANTGLPNIINWQAHEWLWRGNYSLTISRVKDVETLYNSNDTGTAQKLLKKYQISLVYIGKMERDKFPKLDEEKFKNLGILIYNKKGVHIYKII